MYRLRTFSRGLSAVPSSRACPAARAIQTACTVHNDSLTRALRSAIQEASALHHGFTSSDMPSHALVLISRHYFPDTDSSSLAESVHSVITKSLGDDNIDVIGAVVDEIPGPNVASPPRYSKGVSLMLASEDEGASIHVFEDKVDRNISLGRAWKSQGHPENQEAIDDGWLPSGDWKELLGGGTSSSPSESTNIKPVDQVKSAIIVSKGDFSAIDWPAQLFPRAHKYGITAAITPFLTGLPITLMHNRKTLKNGGVAIAFDNRPKSTEVEYPRLKILGEPLTITKAQGNILITLDGQPATFALLERIKSVIQKDLKISKDILLFGQFSHEDTPVSASATLPMIKIIAGDPGKGSIALNGGYRVREGDVVQLYYEDPQASVSVQDEDPGAYKTGIELKFVTVGADSGDTYSTRIADANTNAAAGHLMERVFTGGSCAGIILGGPNRTWVHESVRSETGIHY